MLKDYISVIMLTADPLQEHTQKALTHLSRSTVPYELVLVSRNRDWTAGVVTNQAIAATVGEYVAFCCDDCFIEPSALEEMKKALQDSKVGVVGALLLHSANAYVVHAGIESVALASSDGKRIGYNLRHIGRGEPMEHFATDVDVECVTGALMMTRRDVLETIGWYTAECDLAFGDADFCLRARVAGYRVRFVASARGVHLESTTRGDRIGESGWFLRRWASNPNSILFERTKVPEVVSVGGSNGT
jgi:GT2 family glycosyltransferase